MGIMKEGNLGVEKKTGEVRGRERVLMLRGSVSAATETGKPFPIWKKSPQVIHGTLLSCINNVCIPVFGMCAVVLFVIEVQGMHA